MGTRPKFGLYNTQTIYVIFSEQKRSKDEQEKNEAGKLPMYIYFLFNIEQKV